MNTAPNQHFVPGQRPGEGRGATALGTDAHGRPHHHSRHLMGNTLRAARVFVGTAFDVLVLGDHERRPPPRPTHPVRSARPEDGVPQT